LRIAISSLLLWITLRRLELYTFQKEISEISSLKLLRLQQIYWRQRYTEKLVKFGDENTKFFHARAT